MDYYLSYLMGAKSISDEDLTTLGIEIMGKTDSGSRKLKIPSNEIQNYKNLIKEKLDIGFWNEIIGSENIFFIFKFTDGTVKDLMLNLESEGEIDKLCASFNSEDPDTTANVYKYLSDNDFYRDFMLEHYSELINR